MFPSVLFGQWMEGGDIYYTCLGDGEEPNTRLYKFHLDFYVECDYFPPGFTFSQVIAPLTEDGNSMGLAGVQMDFIRGSQLENPDFACAEIPSGICIKRWQFEGLRELPILDSASYYVVLGNCCLNSSVLNILGPDTSGLSIILPIPSAAQRDCNSSPYFESLPPTILCQNESFTLPSQATDLDGDQLVYKFCAVNEYNNGIFSAPPPFFFSNLSYNFPMFSPSQPLGMGNLTIDATTGTLSGTPTIEGKFIVGICVEEYRNGALLSTIERNFQFNVISCEKEVSAAIDVQNFQGDIPVITHCSDSILEINNLTTTRSNGVPSIRWVVQNDLVEIESTDWHPEFDLPYSGIYEGIFFLNENEICEDSLVFFVKHNKYLKTDLSIDYDSCLAGPVTLRDNTLSDVDSISKYIWNIENTTILSDSETIINYFDDPGNYIIFHKVEDQFGCIDSIYKEINWEPAPKVIIVSPDVSDGCLPLSVEFTNLSWPVDSSYVVNWNFGDEREEGEENGLVTTHIYNEVGVFSPNVEIISPQGCQVSRTFEDLITVNPNPLADFSWEYNLTPSIENEVFLISEVSASSYQWYLNGDLFSNLANATYKYPLNTSHSIKFVVTNDHGCSDSISQEIFLDFPTELFLPNAFTPNYDGENDVFEVVGFVENISSFEMKIFNRSRAIVFQTKDPFVGWNGRFNNNGRLSPNGVYVYKLDYQDINGIKKSKKGFVTLIK